MTRSATRRRRRRLLLGAVVIGLAIAVVLGVRWVRGQWASPPIPTHTVERQMFVRKVTADGNLRTVKATPLAAPPRSHGPVKVAWLAGDGTRINKGDVVVRFDATDMEKQLADGEAALQTAQRKIARERIEVASTMAERERESEVSRLELQQTRTFQRKNELIFSRNDIIESEIDGELSQAKLDHAQATKGIEKSRSQSRLGLLDIEKRAATMQVEQARQGLDGLVLTAPHDGVVVLRRDWRGNEVRVGDQVWPGQPLLEIPHTESMEAEVFVLEADAGGLADGLAAEVRVEAHPDKLHAAKIKRVDKLAKPRIRNAPVQYFGVTLELAATDTAIMKPGQRVRATLTLDEREALVIPRPALFEKDGKKIVYRQVAEDEFAPVEVEVGPSSLGRVVIESGISAGDRIALRDPTDKGEDDEGAGEDRNQGDTEVSTRGGK